MTTPEIVDACLKLECPVKIAPAGIYPLTSGARVSGPVLPVQHYGSVDIFLEAMLQANPHDVLVIDNQNRKDEACIGDLTILEAQYHQLSGIVLWGCHRDAKALIRIGFPVFSYGTYPSGPQRLDKRPDQALGFAHFGDFKVSKNDWVFADADGVVFVPFQRKDDILSVAQSIHKTEQEQAKAIRQGKSLIEQLEFKAYLKERETTPDYTLRNHLQKLKKAIEV